MPAALFAPRGGWRGVRACGCLTEVGGQPLAEDPRVTAGEDPAGQLGAEAVEADLVHPQPGSLGGLLERERHRGVDVAAGPRPDHPLRRFELEDLAPYDAVEAQGPERAGAERETVADGGLEIGGHEPRGQRLARGQRRPDAGSRIRV